MVVRKPATQLQHSTQPQKNQSQTQKTTTQGQAQQAQQAKTRTRTRTRNQQQQQQQRDQEDSKQQKDEFWRGLMDHEFFGPKIQHIYFYSDVTPESVIELRQKILDACEPEISRTSGVRLSPKPIVVHVHSYGGDMFAGNWLLSVFNSIADVPICVMVDAVSASAATMLSVMAPYRVGTPYSMSMLHDYTYQHCNKGKRETIIDRIKGVDDMWQIVKSLYVARTKISKDDLDMIMRRDMWLDADSCLRLGVYDRIVRPDRSEDVRRFIQAEKPVLSSSMSRVYSVCDGSGLASKLDAILGENENAMRPIQYTAPGTLDCNGPEVALAAISRILSSPVPVYGVVDNRLSWWELLPVIFCHRRYMYENATVVSDFAYVKSWGERIKDIVHNSGIMRGLIRRIVNERCTPKPGFMDSVFDRDELISAKECLENGIIDEIIPLSKSEAMHQHHGHGQGHRQGQGQGHRSPR